jgi:hypothetical protein
MRTGLVVLLLLLGTSEVFGQTITIEKRISRDSATGVTTVSWDTIIGKSEDITPINNMIIIDPISFIWRFNARYYRTLSRTVTISLGGNYDWFNGLPDIGSAFGFNAELRLYPNKNAPHGFYMAPDISYDVATGQYSGLDANGNPTSSSVSMITMGALFGWQWFPSDNFCLGLALGFDDYIHVSGPTDVYGFNTIFGNTITGILPAIRFDIGFGW